VASLNRPGGNATGTTFLVSTLLAKQVEILHEMVPRAATIGFLLNPTGPSAMRFRRSIHIANTS
jgi:putative ABC transport system substrate-binding protein